LLSCALYYLKVSFLSSGEPMALLGPSKKDSLPESSSQKDSLPEGSSTEGFFTKIPLQKDSLPESPFTKGLPEGSFTEGFYTRGPLYRRILYQRASLQKDL
jgi:hypothetical protein